MQDEMKDEDEMIKYQTNAIIILLGIIILCGVGTIFVMIYAH